MTRRKEIPFFDQGRVCESHYYLGMLPCPWPECSNGIDADVIVDTFAPLGMRRDEAQRLRWHLPDGTSTFSWHRADEGHVSEVHEMAKREFARRRKLPFALPALAYHYTDLAALYGIVQSQDLWLTDYAYLNDATEISHGLELSRSVVNEFLGRSEYADSPVLAAIHDGLLEPLQPRICVFSFSLDGDSLSQWRAYGGKGGRVSLGFEVGGLLREWHPTLCSFNRVVYDGPAQRAAIETITHLFHAAYVRDKEVKKPTRAVDTRCPAEYMLSRYYEYITFFKHSSFCDERECRLVYTESKRFVHDVRCTPPPKHFSMRRDLIIPHARLREIGVSMRDRPGEDCQKKRLPLREIVVGPQERSDLLVKGVREFLAESGYGDVCVRQSSIPFR